jgi:hypothetical protein
LHNHLLVTTEKHHARRQQQSGQQAIADCSPRPEIFTPPELPKPHTFQTACHTTPISLPPAKRLRPRFVKTLFQRPQ